jgi:hypothetical protein
LYRRRRKTAKYKKGVQPKKEFKAQLYFYQKVRVKNDNLEIE